MPFHLSETATPPRKREQGDIIMMQFRPLSNCAFPLSRRWKSLHVVGWQSQWEALLLGGLRAWNPEVCLWHRAQLHRSQVLLQLWRRLQAVVSAQGVQPPRICMSSGLIGGKSGQVLKSEDNRWEVWGTNSVGKCQEYSTLTIQKQTEVSATRVSI